MQNSACLVPSFDLKSDWRKKSLGLSWSPTQVLSHLKTLLYPWPHRLWCLQGTLKLAQPGFYFSTNVASGSILMPQRMKAYCVMPRHWNLRKWFSSGIVLVPLPWRKVWQTKLGSWIILYLPLVSSLPSLSQFSNFLWLKMPLLLPEVFLLHEKW